MLSQITAFRSKWLVGSSNISKVGSMNRALWAQTLRLRQVDAIPVPLRMFAAAYLARETLILHPPENLLVGLFCISGVNDRPANILLALASAAAAPIALNSS